MADKHEKQATCPICGYTDTALDADALEHAMAEHMQSAHNMSSSVNPDNTDLKKTGRRDTDDGVLPDVPGSVIAPGNNVGTNRPL